MATANVPTQREFKTVADIRIPAALDALKKATGVEISNLNVETLSKALTEFRRLGKVRYLLNQLPEEPEDLGSKVRPGRLDEEQGPTDIEIIESQLRELAKKPGALEQFTHRFAVALLLSNDLQISGVRPETQAFIQEIAPAIEKIRNASPDERGPECIATIGRLRKLEDRLVAFVSETAGLKAADSIKLEEQYREVALGFLCEEDAILSKMPKEFVRALETEGIFTAQEIKQRFPEYQAQFEKLRKAGLLGEANLGEVGNTYAFLGAKTDSSKYEAIVPTPKREAISKAIENELNTRYAKKIQPIGTAVTRGDQLVNLRDEMRIRNIAKEAGVSVPHVELALKYLHDHGLVSLQDGGFVFSAFGKHAGLRLNAIRFVQRARASQEAETEGDLTIDQYLDAAAETRESWEMPTYELKTRTGGAPWTYHLDELLLGNARIAPDIIRAVRKMIQDEPDEALVVISNMIQGNPAVEPRAMRTSLPPGATNGVDTRDYRHQIRLAADLLLSFNKPTIKIDGKNDLETANVRADVQRNRDTDTHKGLESDEVSPESSIKSSLAKLNDIEHNANRKYAAKLHAEILDIVANVVQPLELKLRRKLWSSEQVESKSGGISSNELEIVRDIAELMVEEQQRATGTAQGYARRRAYEIYGAFLKLPEIAGDIYLDKLEEVLFPEKEKLAAGNLISRGGAKVQLYTPNGTPGLEMWHFPELRMGISEARNPIDKAIEYIKSLTAAGKHVPDILTLGSTGVPYFAQTGGGTAIISADTFQASNIDSLYFFTEAPDRHKRRWAVRGGGNYAGAVAFSGGVDLDPISGDFYKTGAYTLRFWNEKVMEQLKANASDGKISRYMDIYATSDFQTGSPTAKPATWLRGLFWAIENGQKEILINGDVFQGQNYPREPIEAQLTGIIGIGDQQEFVAQLLEPVLECIRHKKLADPSWELPRWKITTGNHETNSQSHKGGQGLWFLESLQQQIESFYAGAFGYGIAHSHVFYPRKYVDHEGTDLDYSRVYYDFTKEVGFRIGAQHYVGIGGKGSKATPPIRAAAEHGRGVEQAHRPFHAWLLGHWHTQSFTQSDGIIYGIFGANAAGSAFEYHLGYPTTVPASGRARFYSDRPPEFFFVTDPYLRLQERQLQESKIPVYSNLISQHGSLEEFVEHVRKNVQGRKKGAQNFNELELGRHNYIDTHRRIAA